MILKKFAAVFILILSFNTFANAPVSQMKQLKSAFDQLNFSLQVEWDQKDKKFYNKKVGEFHKTLKKLQAEGLSNEELLEFIKQNIQDKKLAGDIDELFATIKASKMTAKEARAFALDYVSRNYAQGANWLGNASAAILLAGLIIAIALLAVASGPVVTTTTTTGGGWCEDVYVCEEYYDYYYNVWYEDCWWETYCY